MKSLFKGDDFSVFDDPEIASVSFAKSARLFWDCKGTNLFCFCNIYFKSFFRFK